MPRYFLHVKDRSQRQEDPDGEELADLAAARQEGIAVARDLMAECLRCGKPLGLHRQIIVMDQGGDVVSTVSFASALPIEDDLSDTSG